MIKNLINVLAVGGFVPFLTAFYVSQSGYQQAVLTVVYGAILALAIKINE